MRDLPFGARLEARLAADAARLERDLHLIRIPWPAGAVAAGHTGARCIALSAKSGALYEGYSPYGEVYGWKKLTGEKDESGL